MSRLKTVTDSVKHITPEQGKVFNFIRYIPHGRPEINPQNSDYLIHKSNVFNTTAEHRFDTALLIKDPSCLG